MSTEQAENIALRQRLERAESVLRQIDYFGEALIQREWEPGSGTIRGLVAEARSVLSASAAEKRR